MWDKKCKSISFIFITILIYHTTLDARLQTVSGDTNEDDVEEEEEEEDFADEEISPDLPLFDIVEVWKADKTSTPPPGVKVGPPPRLLTYDDDNSSADVDSFVCPPTDSKSPGGNPKTKANLNGNVNITAAGNQTEAGANADAAYRKLQAYLQFESSFTRYMTLTCRAPFPVQLVYEADPKRETVEFLGNGSRLVAEYEYEIYLVRYRNMKEHATYEFSSDTFFKLPSLVKEQKFVCRSVRNPCVYKTLEYSLDGDGSRNFRVVERGEEIFPPLKNSSTAPSAAVINGAEGGGDECDAIFYYEETTETAREPPPMPFEFPNYSFRCKFADGSPGFLKTFECDRRHRCDAILKFSSLPKQKKNCWNPFVPGGECSNCSREGRLNIPFLAMCLKNPDSLESGSSLSFPAFFGVPQGYQVRPKIFFGAALENPRIQQELLFMNPIDEVQLLGSSIWVQCYGSRYLFSSLYFSEFQFAVQIRNSTSGESQLVHLDAPNEKDVDQLRAVFNLQTATAKVVLDSKEITKIYCFTIIAQTFEWRNVSRPVRVVEPREFLQPPKSRCKPNSNSKPQPNRENETPRLVFSFIWPVTDIVGDDYILQRDGERAKMGNVVRKKFTQTYQREIQVYANCSANFPVRLVHQHNKDPKNTDVAFNRETHMRRDFTDFKNKSTYSFSLDNWFSFKNTTRTQVFRCESLLLNPCKHESVEYSYDKGTNEFQFQFFTSDEDRYENENENGAENQDGQDYKFSKNTEREEKNKGKNSQKTESEAEADCQVIFYYEKLPNRPGYSFRCQLPYGEPGEVMAQTCTSCESLYRNRREPSLCWREYSEPESRLAAQRPCSECKELVHPDLTPIVLTCNGWESGWEFTYTLESYKKGFAFFGLWNNETKQPVQLYSSKADADPKTMIFLQDFYKYQVKGEFITFSCGVSLLFFEEQVRFAVGFKGKSDVTFLPDPDSVSSSKSSYSFQATLTLKFFNSNINRIYCISGLVDSFDYFNSSRPIAFRGSFFDGFPGQPEHRKSPQVFFEVTEPESDVEVGQNTDQSSQLLTSGDWTLEEGHVNQAVRCLATGYPPPQVLWSSTAENLPIPAEVYENDTLVSSRLDFPQVYPKMAGQYRCRAENELGSATDYLKLKVNQKDQTKTLVLSIAIPIFVLLLIFAAIGFVVRRRIRRLQKEIRDLTPDEVLLFFEGRPRNSNPSSKKKKSKKMFRGSKLTMEETVENLIHSIPYDKKYEMALDQFQIEEGAILGEGEFGVVTKGVTRKNGYDEIVAIKTVKSDTDVDNFKAILAEIKILIQLKSHENVCKLIGACTTDIKKRKVWIAVEFCSEKDLKKYLEKNSKFCENLFNPPKLRTDGYAQEETILGYTMTTLDLLRISMEISNGMQYLTTKNVIHGDLAARNVLLDENLRVKISDFGLARQLINYSSIYVKKAEGLIPWRWMSLEALAEKQFSIKSDVWSFGVVLWEIFSMAQTPFEQFSLNPQFIEAVRRGFRLAKPNWANAELYKIMNSCWQNEPDHRPKFAHINQQLVNLYRRTSSAAAKNSDNDTDNDDENDIDHEIGSENDDETENEND